MIYLIIIALIFLFFIARTIQKNQPIPSLLKEPYLRFVDFLSDGNVKAISEVELYFDDKNKYFLMYEDELYQRGIESYTDISDVVVLVNALERIDKVVYEDHKAKPEWTLASLNKLSGSALEGARRYQELLSHYQNTKHGLATQLETECEGLSIFQCFKDQGYRLLSIDENSDAYVLIVVKENDFDLAKNLAREAKVALYFEDK